MGDVVTYVVMPTPDGWKVGMTGDSQPEAFYPDRETAIIRAEELARRHELGQVIVRTKEGGVERSYFPGSAAQS